VNRSPFELEYWLRQHSASLEHGAEEWRRTNAAPGRPPRIRTIQRAVGLGLIRAGRRLAGEPAAPAIGAPRPAA